MKNEDIPMKRKLISVLVLSLMLSLAGCGGNGTDEVSPTTENVKTAESIPSETLSAKQPESTEETTSAKQPESTDSTDETASAKQPENTPETKEDTQMTYEIDPTKPMIAITFDDGPNTTTTVQILDILEEHEVRASFFVIGNNINDSSAKVMKRAYDMGCEIANHSQTHSSMNTMTAEDIKAEIEYTSSKVEEITGEAPRFFRPPYIAVNNTMYEAIDMPFICGYGCNDWENNVTAEMRSESVLKQACDGAIILLHDFYGNSQTVEALKTIIPALKEQGYQFVTVTELFNAKGVEIKADDTNLYSVVK